MGPRTSELSCISNKKLRKVFVRCRNASARIRHVVIHNDILKGSIMRRVYLVMLSVAALLVSCSSAEPQPEFKAVSTTQDVMESLVAHMAQEVWDSVKIE